MIRFALAFFLLAAPAHAQSPSQPPSAPSSLPPHAWLFGEWTGGFFPVPAGLSREACLAAPVVVFTRDLAMRATLTEQAYTQREIETARAVPGGIEFRFTSGVSGSRFFGGYSELSGFGCETADVLHVQRRGENEIIFPGCEDFPNPLIRCR